MNNKTAKKIRKVMNKKIRVDMENMARVLSKENFYWRFVYAMRILFKYHPEAIKFEVNKKSSY